MWQIAAEAAHQLFCLPLCLLHLSEWRSCCRLAPSPRLWGAVWTLRCCLQTGGWAQHGETEWFSALFHKTLPNCVNFPPRHCWQPDAELKCGRVSSERGEREEGDTETPAFVGVRSTISYCLVDRRSQHKRWHRSRGDIWLGSALAGSPDTVTAIQVGICCLLLVPPATDGCLTEHEDWLVWKPSLSSAPENSSPASAFPSGRWGQVDNPLLLLILPYPPTGSIMRLRCCRFDCLRSLSGSLQVSGCWSSTMLQWGEFLSAVWNLPEFLSSSETRVPLKNPFWSCILPDWVKMKSVTAQLQSITPGHFSFKWEMSRSLCNTAGSHGGMLPAALPAWWSNRWLMSSTQNCEK